jgi:hypothetical protein
MSTATHYLLNACVQDSTNKYSAPVSVSSSISRGMMQLAAWKIGANFARRGYFLPNFFVSLVTSDHLGALADAICFVTFVMSRAHEELY